MWNKLCLCVAPLKFWFQSDLRGENSATCYMEGRQSLLTFLTVVARWSRSTSNFYALPGQNLTGEFMRKINASSWNLFTLTAEADRVLCQPVMFLTVFFHWMYKMKFKVFVEFSADEHRLNSGLECGWHIYHHAWYSISRNFSWYPKPLPPISKVCYGGWTECLASFHRCWTVKLSSQNQDQGLRKTN